jgi:hypothetical protein
MGHGVILRAERVLPGKAVDVRRRGITNDAAVFVVLHDDDENVTEDR